MCFFKLPLENILQRVHDILPLLRSGSVLPWPLRLLHSLHSHRHQPRTHGKLLSGQRASCLPATEWEVYSVAGLRSVLLRGCDTLDISIRVSCWQSLRDIGDKTCAGMAALCSTIPMYQGKRSTPTVHSRPVHPFCISGSALLCRVITSSSHTCSFLCDLFDPNHPQCSITVTTQRLHQSFTVQCQVEFLKKG